MMKSTTAQGRPAYDFGSGCMLQQRARQAPLLARHVLATIAPFTNRPASELSVLDIGCGYGYMSLELSQVCRQVVGVEPSLPLWQHATELQRSSGKANLAFRCQAIEELTDTSAFDVVVLDNVLEHLPNQALALTNITRALKPKGVLYLVVPNKLWPLEVHYGLPFLSYLPVPWANIYLRVLGRGVDYTDASYAPTLFRLNRLLRQQHELTFNYVLPAQLDWLTCGRCLHYRLGVNLLRRFPWLWVFSKVFLVVATKA
jgi:2-polyprenyl-3-methyl-5-hydroxy-6-metoxy-1,4-benzoquinol methylase